MRIAILLALVAGACALPTPAEQAEEPSSSSAAPELDWLESLPPLPPRLERDLGRTREARDTSDEKQKERQNFLSILEDLNSLARGETPQSAGQVPDNYFVIVGVFSDPELGETALYAERVSLDDVDEEVRERRRRSAVLGMYQQQY